MNRRDFVARIAVATGLPKTKVDQVIRLFLDQVTGALVRDGRLELRNFGVFRSVFLPARTGRNPRSGAAVQIPAAKHVRFRAGKRMREELNP